MDDALSVPEAGAEELLKAGTEKDSIRELNEEADKELEEALDGSVISRIRVNCCIACRPSASLSLMWSRLLILIED